MPKVTQLVSGKANIPTQESVSTASLPEAGMTTLGEGRWNPNHELEVQMEP